MMAGETINATWDSKDDTEPERCRWRNTERSALGGLVSLRCVRGRGHPGQCCFRAHEVRRLDHAAAFDAAEGQGRR